jgi:hypothetical protein
MYGIVLTDLDTLSRVHNELNKNIEILMNNTMNMNIEINKYEEPKDTPRQSRELNKLLQGFMGTLYVANKSDLPESEFADIGWWNYPPPWSEINEDLKNRIDRLYFMMKKANGSLREIKFLLSNTMGFLPPSHAARIKMLQNNYVTEIKDIRKYNIQEVQKLIGIEIEKLKKRKDNLKN